MSLYQKLKELFFPAPPLISEEQALAIAEAMCKKKNWLWRNIRIDLTREGWHVKTCYGFAGGNSRFLIDKNTGEILHMGFISK